MGLWLVLLPLVFSSGCLQSAEATEKMSLCSSNCQPGYYKTGKCKSGEYTCGRCPLNSFTEVSNTRDKCLRCGVCKLNEEAIEPCTQTKNIRCDCKENFFRSRDSSCRKCSQVTDTNERNNDDYKRKCLKKCPGNPTCLTTPVLSTNLASATTTPTVTTTTTGTTTASTTTGTTTATTTTATTATTTEATTTATTTETATTIPFSGTAPHLKKNRTLYLAVHLVLLLTFLLIFGLLLLCCWKTQRNPHRLFCWRFNKPFKIAAQESEYLEKSSHQSSSSAMLRNSWTQAFSEETSVMLNSYEAPPPIQADSAHIDRWPAVVLYAIIKEVPLRRWKEFLRLLSVNDQQMERIELEAGLGSTEKQYQMLRLWCQHSSASVNEIFSSLHYMDLSGCAQRLQESLEKLQQMSENTDCNV